MSITLTDRAASEIKALLAENDKESAALRVWVAGGGCSGLQYGMAIDDGEPEQTDQVFHSNGVRVMIDSVSLSYMAGSQVDYVEDVLGGGFRIDNPNASAACGCGSSFATEEDQEGPPGGCGGCRGAY